MKKWSAFLTSIMLLIGSTISVCAATEPDTDLSVLTEEIVTASNDLFLDKLSREITENDVDFNNAFKIYVGIDLFKTEIDDVAEIPAAFGDDGYIYELPIYLDGNTLIVNIAKGQPLNENVEFTDEERQEILENVGKWQVTAIKYYDNEIVDYTTELENRTGRITENAVLVGGLPYFRYAVALLPDDNGKIENLVPLSDIPGIENINTLQSDSENIYNYEEVKNYINQLPPIAEDKAGAYGFLNVEAAKDSLNSMSIVGGLVILTVIFLSVLVIYVKKYIKRRGLV